MEPTPIEKETAMFIHLSQFAGFIIPALGWVLPLILWLIKRDNSAYIDAQGKIVMNWIISSLIYSIIGFILTFLLVGIIWLIALGVCSIVFIILGAIRAKEGTLWAYPLSITFLK